MLALWCFRPFMDKYGIKTTSRWRQVPSFIQMISSKWPIHLETTQVTGCIRNCPLYPQIVHYLKGQPFPSSELNEWTYVGNSEGGYRGWFQIQPLSLWMDHWIIDSNDSFRNKTLQCCSEMHKCSALSLKKIKIIDNIENIVSKI